MRAKHYRHKARCNRSRNNAAQCKSTPRASSSHTIQGYRRTQTPCQPDVWNLLRLERFGGHLIDPQIFFNTWYPNYRVPFCIRMQRFWSRKSAFSGFNLATSDTSYSIFRTWYPNYRVPFCIRMQRFWSRKSAFSGFNLATIELQQKKCSDVFAPINHSYYIDRPYESY